MPTDEQLNAMSLAVTGYSWNVVTDYQARARVMELCIQANAPKPIDMAELMDAFGCFWNASIGEAHNRNDSTCFAVISCINDGISAVTYRLNEIMESKK